MMRAGVIGVGAMGRHHARVYNQLDDVELVAVADEDADLVKRVARRYKIPAYADYREMLARERLDLVSIAVPTQFHHRVALNVIEHRMHLLVEKPIASTVSEGREMVESAARAGCILTVGHIERFNPAITELRRRLQRGELGRVFLMHARRLGPFPRRIRDAGVVIDLATHDLDVMRYLLGTEVDRLFAETARRIHTDHEDLLMGLVRFRDGTLGALDINWLTPTKIRELQVTGERGMFVANYLTQDLYFYENHQAKGDWETLGILRGVGEGNVTKLYIEQREPLEAELDAFVRAVREGIEPRVTGADALATLALAIQLVASGERHTVLEGKMV